ncbi:hypothetical protein DSCA_36690 [Desulfosarcina alkanivorans]|uniref:histidine kinase n=2 Tax=Desulfosarcina alkanivorans TaxID=571177 RepID=A0A5K7YPE1_9BACT|nr:hypothetical protein DSCA_36690 [Desulfosarcina alkanivorans]
MCNSLEALLKSRTYEVSSANCGKDALVSLKTTQFDLVILDVHLQDIRGHEILSHIKIQHPDTPVIFIAGDTDLDSALLALRCGAYNYIRKPFEPDELLKTVENALTQRLLRQEKDIIDQELKLSEAMYRSLVENIPDIIYTLDTDGKFTFLSESVEQLLGYAPEELIGKHYATFVAKADRKKVHWLFNEGRSGNRTTTELELRLQASEKKFGPDRFLNVEVKSIGIYESVPPDGKKRFVGTHGVIRDIHEKKRLQTQLHIAQRMEALGTLAGGIAHDFNNLLMGIQGRCTLVSMDLGDAHPLAEHLNAIDDYICSARGLTDQLLGYTRGGKYEVKPIDINDMLQTTATMFGRTKKEIAIHIEFHDGDIVVEADSRQIEQVLINLFVNAWQAMPGGGTLHLNTRVITLDEEFCTAYRLEPGTYARIKVIDTGIGIDTENLSRIFDPFFTTKERNRGTGLGLASAFGIVKNHCGTITVYSEVGQGTTFTVYLPALDKPVVKHVSEKEEIITGTGTILLVDDEDMILEVGQQILERLGYRVATANSGQQAIETLQQMGSKIDLVLLDMVMPGMGGGDVFDHIREILPDIRVILSSGYAIDGQAREIIKRGCNGFIQKPFVVSELSQKISRLGIEKNNSIREKRKNQNC